MHIKSHVFSVEAEAGQAVFINSRIDDMGNWNSAIVCNITRAPPVWHLLNFQVCVKRRNRQLDNMAFIPHPKSLHNQLKEKKKRAHERLY